MKKKIQCKAVFFDLWDTLVNSNHFNRKLIKKMKMQKMPRTEFIGRLENIALRKNYPSIEKFLETIFQEFRINPSEKKKKEITKFWIKWAKKAKLFPETKKALSALKKRGFKLAMVSNCQYFYTRYMLKRLKLERFFDSVQLSFETGSIKPEPKMFNRALKELCLKPSETVMVGDSPADATGAKNAGMRAIKIQRKNCTKKRFKTIATISSLEQLIELLEKESDNA